MNKKISSVLAIGIILIITIIIGGIIWLDSKRQDENKFNTVPNQNTSTSSNYILDELQKLKIQPTGTSNQIKAQLPLTLTDANWGMKKIICEEGGYDLSIYGGKTLTLTSYPINEVYKNTEPLNVWIINSENKVICVYKSVRENSELTPGIFSVKENLLINKK